MLLYCLFSPERKKGLALAFSFPLVLSLYVLALDVLGWIVSFFLPSCRERAENVRACRDIYLN